MSNVEQLPVERRELMAGAPVKAVVPGSMEDAYRIAIAVCKAGMAPKGLDTPEKALVAILHGLEIGLTPMAALQRIAVVNGRPTIWGDGAVGLVRGSGLCEFIKERIDGEGDSMEAVCEAKRRHEPEPIVARFSIADAKKAGLWGKAGPWTQFPKRMLQMRARAFALRDGFADVLGGLYLREEIEADMRDVTPASSVMPPPPPPAATSPVKTALRESLRIEQEKEQAPEMVDAETGEVLEAEVIDPDKYLDDFDGQMAGCREMAQLEEVWLQHEDRINDLFPSDREAAHKLRTQHEKRLAR